MGEPRIVDVGTYAAGMRFDELERAMASRLPQLGKRLRQLARYALAHPDEMGRETVATLARRLAAPPSSLVRFAQTFGFRGYREMQRVFRSHRASAAMVEQLVEADIQALQALKMGPPARELSLIAKLLTEHRAVYLLASPHWFAVACYLSYALANLALNNVLVSGVGGIEQLGSLGALDLLLVLEPEGCTASVVQAAIAAAERGVALAVLTASPSSRLGKRAQACLTLPRAVADAPRSLAVPMTLGVTLVVAVGHARARNDAAAASATGAQGVASRMACNSDASPAASWLASQAMMPP